MTPLLVDLAEQHAELDGLLRGLAPADRARPTPCVGWDVDDVVMHLHQTDELARASLLGELDASIEALMRAGAGSVDEAAARSVTAARGTAGDVVTRWRESAAGLRAELAGADPGARVQWVVGRLSVRTLVATRIAECWIHTTDVAAALGTKVAPTGRLRRVARLAWRTLPYAFERDGRAAPGPVAFDLTGPAGETWTFRPDDPPATVVAGPAVDLCLVAARRLDPAATALRATGPDADAVLELVRTYA